MRRGVVLFALVVLSIALSACQGHEVTVKDVAHYVPRQINLSEPSAVVATVNGYNLTVADVASSAIRYGVQPTTSNFDALLDDLIVARLATQNAPPVNESDLSARIASIRGNLTNEQLSAVLASQGLTIGLIKERIREEIAMNELFGGRVVQPSQQDISAYYAQNAASFVTPERVVIRHFFISNATRNASEEEGVLKGYLATNSSDLCAYIANHSDDRASASSCGVMAITRGSVPPGLEYAAYGTPPGTTRVVTASNGIHVITGLGIVPAQSLNLTAATPAITKLLESQERARLAARKVSKLLEKANITVYYLR